MRRFSSYFVAITIVTSILLSSCSLKKMAMDTVIGALSDGGGGNAFTSDNDPELVGDALPFALKLYETLLIQSPDNDGLLLTTGSGFVMYANAFVQLPADMLSSAEYERKQEMRNRAKQLYLRGRDYLLEALDVRHPGFFASIGTDDFDEMLGKTDVSDVPYLYWAGSGWMAAISINSFDVQLGLTMKTALALLLRALELDETYSLGAIHEVLISFYGSMPELMGGSEEKAREHFKRAVEISGGTKPGPYISLAQAVSVKKQDHEEFIELLNTAIGIETTDPDSTLLNIIQQRKARWLLEHVGDFFLI